MHKRIYDHINGCQVWIVKLEKESVAAKLTMSFAE